MNECGDSSDYIINQSGTNTNENKNKNKNKYIGTYVIFMSIAFAPAHITGFFLVHRDDDILHTGSCGCGITLSHGVTSTVATRSITKDGHSCVFIDGVPHTRGPAVDCVEELASSGINVDINSCIPSGCGLGASGAGTLATAIAIDDALKLNLSPAAIVQVAHKAEVRNSTGLGDVVAQATGGLVVRTKAGASPFGVCRQIPCRPQEIAYVTMGEISTASILSDKNAISAINRAGKNALKEFLQKPCIEMFMAQSKEFAINSGIIDDAVLDAIEAVEAAGGLASQAMLGKTVFATGGADVVDALGEFGQVLVSHIDTKGAMLIDMPNK